MQEQALAVKNPVVLVIDDDVAVRNSLKFSLEIEGFAVRTYATSATLLEDRDLPAHGCLVLDYNLPDMNGLALLQSLRQRGTTMPAILITTHPSPALRARASAMGIGIVEKPLLGNTLLEELRAALAAPSPPAPS
jgi:two-component system response regulator FixJ